MKARLSRNNIDSGKKEGMHPDLSQKKCLGTRGQSLLLPYPDLTLMKKMVCLF
jgi:hypothetical protein